MATSFKFEETCQNAGLEVMGQILGIVHNREEVPLEVLDALDEAAIYELYEGFIGPAVDDVEKSLLGLFD